MYNELKKLICADDVLAVIDSQILESLGADGRMETAINSAVAWCWAMIKRTGANKLPTDTEILKLALVKRSAYELYTVCDVEESAEDKRTDAKELLEAVLGLGEKTNCTAGKISFDN